MVIASYDPTAFEKTMGNVMILAVLIVILIIHVLLVGKILRSERTEKGKRIIGMVAVASIFWVIAYFPMMMGYANMLSYGFAIRSGMFFFPSILYLFGAFLLCLGSTIGYYITF
ncbi:MAG: hypothetical protein ACW97W_18425 [Candidatus Hodarchaeales archaeon]